MPGPLIGGIEEEVVIGADDVSHGGGSFGSSEGAIFWLDETVVGEMSELAMSWDGSSLEVTTSSGVLCVTTGVSEQDD